MRASGGGVVGCLAEGGEGLGGCGEGAGLGCCEGYGGHDVFLGCGFLLVSGEC